MPPLPRSASLDEVFANPAFRATLTARLLPAFLPRQRWFTSKGKTIGACRLDNFYPLTPATGIATVAVDFTDGTREHYQLPLGLNRDAEEHRAYAADHPGLVLGELEGGDYLVDAVPRADFRAALYARMRAGRADDNGLLAEAGKALQTGPETATGTVPAIDTSNTAIIYADRFFCKLFRKLDAGLNPDLELVRFLSERTEFEHCPPYGGSLGVGDPEAEDFLNLGLMTGKVDNRGDAWALFQDLTARYYAGDGNVDAETLDRVGLLAERTAGMHRALASAGPDRPALVPEMMTADYRREITTAARRLLDRQLSQLGDQLAGLSPANRQLAERVLDHRPTLDARLGALAEREMDGQLIRIHGDYHLGQVLYTADDFYIIDFEGEPLLTIPERRRKRPALKDVGGMVRSFHYAAHAQLLLNPERYAGRDLEDRAENWYRTVTATYLEHYFAACGGADFLPAAAEDRTALARLFVLEKAVYEVAYELNSRPDWLGIPLKGVLSLL